MTHDITCAFDFPLEATVTATYEDVPLTGTDNYPTAYEAELQRVEVEHITFLGVRYTPLEFSERYGLKAWQAMSEELSAYAAEEYDFD